MTPDAPTLPRGSSMGQWARDVADTYSALADAEGWPQRRSALTTEAAKYYGIAARMDRIRHKEAPPPCQTGSDGASRPERGQP